MHPDQSLDDMSGDVGNLKAATDDTRKQNTLISAPKIHWSQLEPLASNKVMIRVFVSLT
jgi:hypothetical protein